MSAVVISLDAHKAAREVLSAASEVRQLMEMVVAIAEVSEQTEKRRQTIEAYLESQVRKQDSL